MKDLDTGKDKIAKICRALRQETLEPAEREAEAILERAREEAKAIVERAKLEALDLHEETKAKLQREKSVFQTALEQAGRQSLEFLRQRLEREFFQEGALSKLTRVTNELDVIHAFADGVIQSIEKEGALQDISLFVSKSVSPKEVAECLGAAFLKKLKEGDVLLGDFDGGIRVKLHDRNFTIDLSAQALVSLLASHVARQDFRKLLFAGV